MNPAHDKLLRSLAVLLSAVACLALPSRADDPPAAAEPVELKTLRIEYRQRLVKARTPADELYRSQLRSLLERYKRAGNLDASVAVQAEMQNPDPTQPVPPDKPLPPDLAGIRSAYLVNAQRQTHPVEGWYRQQLDKLEKTLVQRGDIPGAQAVRVELGVKPAPAPGAIAGSTAPASGEWTVFYGGKIKGDARGAELTGPGSGHGDLEMTMAFLGRDMGNGFVVTGKIRVMGHAGGFALGRDERSSLLVYWSRGSSWAVHHDGLTRTVIDQPVIAWKPETWQDFELHREGGELFVKIDKSMATVKIPKGIGKWQFGLLTKYRPSSVEVKNLRFSSP